MPILSWSALVLGSISTSMTGSGKEILSRRIGCSGSDSVSPVKVSLRPTMAAMSPAYTSLELLAVVGVHLEDAPDPLLLAP